MGSYAPPLDQLLNLGRPDLAEEEINYLSLGIVPEHTTDLIRMLNDEELFDTEPQWYSQIHAWRALGQLRVPEAVGPLLDLIDVNEDDDGFNDWITEDLPEVLGRFGPSIIPAVVSRVAHHLRGQFPAVDFANVLVAVGKQHSDARPEAVRQLCRILGTASTNDPSLNGFVVSDLIELKATEAWPDIEHAYATGNVDPSITGDVAEAKYHMGLGPKPPRMYPPPAPHPSAQNAKQRFNERQRLKKLGKKQNKKKRKGK